MCEWVCAVCGLVCDSVLKLLSNQRGIKNIQKETFRDYYMLPGVNQNGSQWRGSTENELGRQKPA